MEPMHATPLPAAEARKQTATYVLLLGPVLFWGSAFAASKAVIGPVPPSVAAFIRFALGTLVMLALLGVKREFVLPRGNWGRLTVLGLMGVTFYNLLFFLGLASSRASDGTMIIPTMSPTVTALLAALVLKEPLRKWQVAGVLVALCGSAVFLTAVGISESDTARLAGDLCFLGSAVCWSVYTLMGRGVLQSLNPFHATAYAMLIGAIGLGVIAAPELVRVQWSELSFSFWAIQLYMAVFPTALANWFYYLGVQRIGPTRTAVFMYLVPVSGLFWAWLVFGDWLGPWQAVGSVLLLAGVWLVNRRGR